MLLHDWLSGVEKSEIARAIAGTPGAMAALSGLHAVAFATLMGSALVANLRACGMLLIDAPPAVVIQPATRLIAWAAMASAATGLALFMPGAVANAQSVAFIVKLLSVVTALLLQRRLAALVRRGSHAGAIKRIGLLAAASWLAAAVAACLFILVE